MTDDQSLRWRVSDPPLVPTMLMALMSLAAVAGGYHFSRKPWKG